MVEGTVKNRSGRKILRERLKNRAHATIVIAIDWHRIKQDVRGAGALELVDFPLAVLCAAHRSHLLRHLIGNRGRSTVHIALGGRGHYRFSLFAKSLENEEPIA